MNDFAKKLGSIKVGGRVTARVSGWLGTVIAINKKNPSSPIRVKWDTNGEESNENHMSVIVETYKGVDKSPFLNSWRRDGYEIG